MLPLIKNSYVIPLGLVMSSVQFAEAPVFKTEEYTFVFCFLINLFIFSVTNIKAHLPYKMPERRKKPDAGMML